MAASFEPAGTSSVPSASSRFVSFTPRASPVASFVVVTNPDARPAAVSASVTTSKLALLSDSVYWAAYSAIAVSLIFN